MVGSIAVFGPGALPYCQPVSLPNAVTNVCSMLFSTADSNCHGWATLVKQSVARHFSCPGRDASAHEVTAL